MFDRAVIDTDRFMDLSMSSKALYFLLGMEADDEGFVSYKKVMRIHGGNEDDIKVLSVKNFIIPFESGVVVITDWNRNNWLDSRRITPTVYEKEKSLLTLTEGKSYLLSKCLASIEENSIEENSIEEKPSKNTKAEDKLLHGEISQIIKLFEDVDVKNKTYYSNKTQRSACKFLIEEYGFDSVEKVVKLLPQTNQQEYFPKITNPYELKEKYQKLAIALSQVKRKQEAVFNQIIL